MNSVGNVLPQRVSQEQQAKEMRRRQAVIQSGYAFIVLELINMHYRRVSAVDDLVAIPTENNRYTFQIVQRQVKFEPDPNYGGILTAHILDTENNRKFLASHLDGEYWEITAVISGRRGKHLDLDDVVREIEELSEQLKNVVVEKTDVPCLLPTTRPFDVAELDEDVLQRELDRRKELKKVDIKAISEGTSKLEVSEESDVPPKDPEGIPVRKPKDSDSPTEPPKKRRRGKRENVVVSEKNGVVVKTDRSGPDSSFVQTSPAGMVQP